MTLDTDTIQQGKRIIEGLLFCSSDPIPFKKLNDVLSEFLPITKEQLTELLHEMAQEYEDQNRAFRLEEIANGYILRTSEDLSPYIQRLLKSHRPERLSHAAAETLAIVAYRQPITRPQIEEIRGVDSSGVMHSLIERQLIEPVGKLEVPGRPTLFGITKYFLKHFGLKDLKELPKIG